MQIVFNLNYKAKYQYCSKKIITPIVKKLFIKHFFKIIFNTRTLVFDLY